MSIVGVPDFNLIDKDISFKEGVQKYFGGFFSFDLIGNELFISDNDLIGSKLVFFSFALKREGNVLFFDISKKDTLRNVIVALNLLMRFLKRIDCQTQPFLQELKKDCSRLVFTEVGENLKVTEDIKQGLTITPDNYWFSFEDWQLDKISIQFVKDAMQMGIEDDLLEINDYLGNPICFFEQIMFYEIGRIVGLNKEVSKEIVLENSLTIKDNKKKDRCDDYLSFMGDE